MGVPRIDRLARLPIFVSLAGKHAVVAGSGAAAAWKAELLSAAGARVDVFAPSPCDGLLRLRAGRRCGSVAVHRRGWSAKDCAGAVIAIGAIAEEPEASRFAAAARAAGAWVNIVDNAGHCDFTLGAIVNRSPMVIGISTDGAAPAFAQLVRAWLEALIPAGFSRWARAAQEWRARLRCARLPAPARRRFWRYFSERAHMRCERAPRDSDFDALVAAALRGEARPAPAVSFHGVQPDSPDRLTLGGVRALQMADVVLHDDRVASDVLAFARREARIIPVRADRSPHRDGDIGALMVALARQGSSVLRLVAGEASFSIRVAKEAAACRAAGIEVTMVPGLDRTAHRPAPHRRPRACVEGPRGDGRPYPADQKIMPEGRPQRSVAPPPSEKDRARQ
jgi:uroporphyrin-III C-methyltransferase/precorrin-2 dehydrogenase/sirohydrochlorin ferrochelatase